MKEDKEKNNEEEFIEVTDSQVDIDGPIFSVLEGKGSEPSK